MDVTPGATLKTSVSGVSFGKQSISSKTRLIGTFTSGGVLEKGEEIQFIGVEAVAVEEVEEYSEESKKK